MVGKVMVQITQYRNLFILALLDRIISHADREALWEFHQRPMFVIGGGKRATLSEWVAFKRERAYNEGWFRYRGTDVIDRACDSVMDRFMALPENGESGVDCRNHLRGFLTYASKVSSEGPPVGLVDNEVRVAQLMQRHLERHFFWCIQESLRSSNPLMARYDWHVNGFKMTLWFPKTVYGRERRHWLKTHILDLESLRPQDRDRVQSQVDMFFGLPYLISFDHQRERSADNTEVAGPTPDMTRLDSQERPTIREMIADEKVASIDMQRSVIKAMGPERLREFIVAYLANDGERDGSLAKEFNLSPAARSRFAGRTWIERRGKQSLPKNIPDLHVNIAFIFANNPSFVNAAQQAGVLRNLTAAKVQAKAILKKAKPVRMETCRDGNPA